MRAFLLLVVVAVLLGFAATPSLAVLPDEVLADAALEARARALSAEIRCLVCQNQSIDDSEAELARELRLILRERLVAGDTDAEVLDYLVARYGEFVLLRPRFNATTALSWLAPPLLLLGGAWLAWRVVRRRGEGANAESANLTADEEKRLRVVLKDTGADASGRQPPVRS